MNGTKVAVIGAGEIGQAMGKLLSAGHATVNSWDSNPALMPIKKQSSEIVQDSEYVLLCVPSWAMRAAILEITPALRRDAIVVSFAKGIEKDSLKTGAELLVDILPQGQPCAVVGGPMLSHEIAADRPAAGVVASTDETALARLQGLFVAPKLATEISTDFFGVSLMGVLKNVYALALGMVDALDLGDNGKGYVLGRALTEMAIIGNHFGARPETVVGIAGAGDLVASGYGHSSRNREVGYEMVKNGKYDLRTEGPTSLPLLLARLGENAKSLRLLQFLKHSIIDEEGVTWQSLLSL